MCLHGRTVHKNFRSFMPTLKIDRKLIPASKTVKYLYVVVDCTDVCCT